MKSILVRSVMLKGEHFQPLEIEIQLVPGLPTIQFLGLPSPGLKESAMRIRTAIRSAGFQMPKGRQILVDVRPRDEKKHGRGVDLAVALGYLQLTEQIAIELFDQHCFYGDLGLSGDIMAPSDWNRVRILSEGALVTGVGPTPLEFRGGRRGEGVLVLTHLHDLEMHFAPRAMEASKMPMQSASGDIDEGLQLEEKQAELARLAAVGGHSLLLAGPQGTGKSTLARIVHGLRPSPSVEDVCEIETWSGENVRPLVEPHHTASELAMVGGRQPPRPGAITRAHCGTLLLDEVLLFRPEVQEALREPLETGVVHLARGPESRKFPADFQLIGTTNLCECGMFTPNESNRKKDLCRCPGRVRSRFDARLRGPFVDRFQMLAFTDMWAPAQGRVSLNQLREEIARTDAFQKSQGRQNGNRRWRPLTSASAREKLLFETLPKDGSERRRLSIQRVARTFADLDRREEIEEADLFRAREWALSSFAELQKQAGSSEAR
ncbi:YifB family Mg chelatase-like AAA ATPase [soil metagenome]